MTGKEIETQLALGSLKFYNEVERYGEYVKQYSDDVGKVIPKASANVLTTLLSIPALNDRKLYWYVFEIVRAKNFNHTHAKTILHCEQWYDALCMSGSFNIVFRLLKALSEGV